jgi:hypothetical protein
MKQQGYAIMRGGAVLYSDSRDEVRLKYGLVLGSKYLVPTLAGRLLMTITKVDYDNGVAIAEAPGCSTVLEHGQDVRACWTSDTLIKNPLVKVSLV